MARRKLRELDVTSAPLTDDQAALMLKVQALDCKVSFRRVYEGTSPVVFNHILRVNRDRGQAEDILQESYLRAWNHRGRFDATRGQVVSWLSRIAHNLAVSSLRSPRPIYGSLDGDADLYEAVESPLPRPDQIVMEGQVVRAVRSEVQRLPAGDRELIHLCYYEDFSHRQLAEHLQVPLGTVKSRIRRTLASMRRELQRG